MIREIWEASEQQKCRYERSDIDTLSQPERELKKVWV